MPSKRYRLLQNHPYAEKGTIVELASVYSDRKGYAPIDMEGGMLIVIPLAVEHAWLEEVKEEPMCSKEFAEVLKDQIALIGWGRGMADVELWIDSRTSK